MKLGKYELGWHKIDPSSEKFKTKEKLYQAIKCAVIKQSNKITADFPNLKQQVTEAIASMEQLAVSFTHDDPRSNLTDKILRTPTNTFEDVYAIFLKRMAACCNSLPQPDPNQDREKFEPRIKIEGVDSGAKDVTIYEVAKIIWEEIRDALK